MSLIAVSTTVQHTGTYFIQKLVWRLTGLHTDWIAHVPNEDRAKSDIGMLQSHIYPQDWPQPDAPHMNACIELMLRSGLPLLIPMRDPVLALISHIERERGEHPRLTFHDHVRSFERIAEMEGATYVPIDLGFHVKHAQNVAWAIEGFHGKYPFRMTPAAAANDWSPENATDPKLHSPLRTLYKDGEWKKLDGVFKGAITRARDTLLPFLSGLGYDLPWM